VERQDKESAWRLARRRRQCAVGQVAFSRDKGRSVAIADKRVFMWECAGGKKTLEYDFQGKVQYVCFAPGANLLAVCYSERIKAERGPEKTQFIIESYDLATDKKIPKTYIATAPIADLQYTGDTKLLAAADTTGGPIVLDASSMAPVPTASPVGASKVLAIDPAHIRLVILDEGRVKIATWHETRDPAGKTVRYWQTREDLPVVREARRIPAVCFSADVKRIATTRYGGFTLWGLK
jgi:hypothetical protein